ncbi:MAG: hypothetical protein ABSC01_08590 [Verrucomicrobiota bacterium]|jgi:hypothetical protein
MNALIIALITALIAALIAVWRPGSDARRRFRGEMARLKSEVDDKLDDASFPTWLLRSQVTVEKECGLVQNSIGIFWRKKFAIARKMYAEKDWNQWREPNTALGFARAYEPYQTGKLRCKGLLQDLSDCAKW